MRIFGEHDAATVEQLQRCAAAEPDAPAVLCADGHLGYSMPIGGVVGYRDHISPSGVGYDIACGNLAVRTTLRASDLTPKEYERIADQIKQRVSFGMGRSNREPIRDHDVFDTIAHSPVEVTSPRLNAWRNSFTRELCRPSILRKRPKTADAGFTTLASIRQESYASKQAGV